MGAQARGKALNDGEGWGGSLLPIHGWMRVREPACPMLTEGGATGFAVGSRELGGAARPGPRF